MIYPNLAGVKNLIASSPLKIIYYDEKNTYLFSIGDQT